MQKNISILNTSLIKLLGIITLTCDTLGIFLMAKHASITPTYNVGFIFRIIGTVSYPLLMFAYINEYRKTDNKNSFIKDYSLSLMLPLLILQTVIYILGRFDIVNEYIYLLPNMPGHIFMDIFLILITVYLASNKNKYIKLFSILPIAYICTCFGFNVAEHIGLDGSVPNFPNYIRPQLDLISLIIGLGYYFASPLSIKINEKLNKESPIESSETNLYKILSVSILFLSVLIYWVLTTYTNMIDIYSVNDSHILTYCLISCLILLMYSKEEIKLPRYMPYIENVYYLMHIIIILIIFTVL